MGTWKNREVTITEVGEGRLLVTVSGEHDISTGDRLGEQLTRAVNTGAAVVCDLTATTFMDSSSVRLLVQADHLAQAGRREFAVVVVPGSMPDRLLRTTGVIRTLDVYETTERALVALDSATDPVTARRWLMRRERIVKNEAAFRDYNDRRLAAEPVGADDEQELIPFVCECGDEDCIQTLMITAAEFTEAHAAPNQFLIKPGHIYPDVEVLVSESETFAVVAKLIGRTAPVSG